MDLNLVCGPAALAEKRRQQQTQQSLADPASPESPTAPLPSIHELENIRVSLGEGSSIHAEEAPPSMAHGFSYPDYGSSKLTATASLATPPNSALYRHVDTQLAPDSGSQQLAAAPPARPATATAAAAGASAYASASASVPASASASAAAADVRHTYAEQRAHPDGRARPRDAAAVIDLAAGAGADADCGAKGSKSVSSGSCDEKRRSSILEKYRAELREVAEKCKILSQFSEQYGPEKNKFNAQPSDDLVIDMARKAYEVLMVFMTIRRERMSTSADDDTMEYIRKRRTVLSTARTKTRKRSKRSDAAQPNTCRSCGISETPEWRRGPDGARTLCNACGLHYAKLNKKRATEANTHPGAETAAPASLAGDVSPQTSSSAGAPLAAHISNGPSQAAAHAHPQAQHPAAQYAHYPQAHDHAHSHSHAQAYPPSHASLSSHSHNHHQQMPATAQPSRPMLREFVSPHSHVHSGASSGGPAPHIPQPAHGAPWPQPAYYQQPAYHYQNGPAHAQHGAGGYMPHGHPAQPSPYHRHSAASSYASSTPQSSNASVSAPAGHPDQQSPTQPQPRPVKTSISRILG